MSIQRLPPDVSSKIAAGEVIERPASVVRELLDNALDADAQNIRISVEDGGKTFIEVIDDGVGIASTQLPIAIERHSTSKLTSVDDLTRIDTLGFRGEALASITAVAELRLRSVPVEGEPGLEILARNNQLIDQRPVGGARGTRAIVRGLFRTLPARLEFLRANRTELNHVVSMVNRAAISHPNVAFELRDGQHERLRTPGTGNLQYTLHAIYGSEIVDDLIPLPPGQTLGIDGFVSQPHLHRPSRAEISFFVNGRWVTDRLLSAAVSEAYRNVVPSGRFPVIVLHLSLPPEEIDVNIHPAKAEIRFRKGSEVFRRVSATIRRALASSGETAPASFGEPVIDQFFFPTEKMAWRPSESMTDRTFDTAQKTGKEVHNRTSSDAPGLPKQHDPAMQPLGQIDNTYIAAAGARGLYLLDQHAAHERVLYEKLARAENNTAQQIIDPVNITLTADESEWVTEHADSLRLLGLDISPFGSDSWLIRTVPSALGKKDAADYFREVITEARTPEFRRLETTEQARWSMACRAAVKSGDTLSIAEMYQLIIDLQECDLGKTCPHGRPTIVLLSRDMLNKQFGRV